ncbi:PAS domain S-box protein [Fictibacillus enclensis]|uniref:PAS domain S-box protein n=1 Tax=Fictibacillus enclensis TaxID=1017270 RepID=UPI0025A30BB7|nr:PAS domain S-box protein [Fictibacillus enclensis]MDM5198063.1 PAS domain S-box protein [Fictibacillus enclensis]
MNAEWFFQVSEEIYIVCNEQGMIQQTNSAWNNLTGYKQQEILHRPLISFFPPELHEQFTRWSSGLRSSEYAHFDCKVMGKTVDIRHVKWTHGTIVNNQLLYLKGILSPISDGKAALELHKSVIEKQADPAVMIDLETNVLAINPAFEELFGWSQDEMIGRTLPNIPPLLYPSFLHYLEVAKTGQKIANLETHRLKKNRELLNVSVTVSPVKDENGNVIALSAVTRDISKRKQIEWELVRKTAELKEANKRCETILQSITDGFYTLDEELRFTYMNKPLQKMWKIPAEELLGKVISDAFPVVLQHPFKEHFRKTIEQQVPCNFQVYSDTFDKYFDIRTYPTDNGVAVFLKDYTELQNVLQRLQESQEILREITENAKESFCIHSPDFSKIYFLSAGGEDILGKPLAEILNNPVLALQCIHPEDQEAVRSTGEKRPETIINIDYRLNHPKRGQRWIRWRRYPVFPVEDKVFKNVSIWEDITDLKEKEQQIKKTEKFEIVSQLAAGVAHEIRNPLTTIKGFLQMNQHTVNIPYEEIIMSELETIEQILHEFLILAKPHHEIKLGKKNISLILKDLLRQMKNESFLQNISIIPDLNVDLPFIKCDEKHIRQLILNLFKNASDAMPNGGKLWISSFADEHQVNITIRDNGQGMPAERLDRVGEPFYSNKEKGIGLGLMVSRKIMQIHEGTMDLKSEEGKGTTVILRFPL